LDPSGCVVFGGPGSLPLLDVRSWAGSLYTAKAVPE